MSTRRAFLRGAAAAAALAGAPELARGAWPDLRADFRAVGDGQADDTAAVQAWLSAGQATGEPLYAPSGRYLIDPVRVVLQDDQPFTVRGAWPGKAGRGTQFVSRSRHAGPLVTIDGGWQESRIRVEGLRLSGAGRGGDGLRVLRSSRRTTLDDVWADGFAGAGLWLTALIGVDVRACHAEGNGWGLRHDTERGQASKGEGSITASKFASNTTGQVLLGWGTTFLAFEGCTIYGAAAGNCGVDFGDGLYAISFRACNFENATPGLFLGAGDALANLVVEGCVFNPQGAAGAIRYAMRFAGALRHSIIRGNHINAQVPAGATVIGISGAAGSRTNEIRANGWSKDGPGTYIHAEG